MPSKEGDKLYVDLRFYFKRETETFGHDEAYEHIELHKVVRKRINNITHDELESVGESFAQMDDYHIFFLNDVPYTISEGVTSKF